MYKRQNIDYKPEKDNVSICNYSIDVVPTEPGGKEEPEKCPCEGDTCDNSGDVYKRQLQSGSGHGIHPSGKRNPQEWMRRCESG